MYESINIEIENIDHLGIIAGIVDEVGIVEIVNQKLPSYPIRLHIISCGWEI
ncbi:DUF4277 domain-containing protein [Cyanobacterium sp. IPPAS B-1200]|uniref:DUF4277 domain-containing protein n=1 Tax=Cyanobacterium sp. IPPAS B-1200 TaxID=1562720 RepID=UPI0009F53352